MIWPHIKSKWKRGLVLPLKSNRLTFTNFYCRVKGLSRFLLFKLKEYMRLDGEIFWPTFYKFDFLFLFIINICYYNYHFIIKQFDYNVINFSIYIWHRDPSPLEVLSYCKRQSRQKTNNTNPIPISLKVARMDWDPRKPAPLPSLLVQKAKKDKWAF